MAARFSTFAAFYDDDAEIEAVTTAASLDTEPSTDFVTADGMEVPGIGFVDADDDDGFATVKRRSRAKTNKLTPKTLAQFGGSSSGYESGSERHVRKCNKPKPCTKHAQGMCSALLDSDGTHHVTLRDGAILTVYH